MTQQLIDRYNAMRAKAGVGSCFDVPAGEAIIKAGEIPMGAMVMCTPRGDLTYHGDHIAIAGQRQPVVLDDAKRADLLVHYALTQSRRGMHVGA